MQVFRTTSRQNRARRMSRAQAFDAQGVSLKFPNRSWSGVRFEDGVVVLAMHEDHVLSDEDGYSCLLWTPSGEDTVWMDAPSKQERLEHCRLAVQQGHADGLLVRGEMAQVEPDELLTLRVEKRGGEYWARWGCSALRAPRLDERLYVARIAA